jgi:N-acyl-D-amino-acid deacylase
LNEKGEDSLVYELIILNGRVYDGTGNPWFWADIAIDNGKICKVGKVNDREVERMIDASGLFICPGFIDIHTHSEVTLLVNNKAESAVRQGVTLHVTGNCGRSAAPILEESRDLLLDFNLRGFNEIIEVDWISFGEYLDRVQNNGVAINVASLLGHGTARICVMGYEKRRPTEDELYTMKNIISRSMIDGAFGMSVGLNIVPSGFAEKIEIIELCRVVAKYGGTYYPHKRGMGFHKDTLEQVEIGEEALVPVHLPHHRPVIYRTWRGDIKDILNIMYDAREKGTDLTSDLYPYLRSGGGLRGMLPAWVSEGGPKKTLERIKNDEVKEKIKNDILQGGAPHMGFIATAGIWDKVTLLQHNKSEDYVGKTLSEIADMMEVQPLDAIFKLMVLEGEGSSGFPTTQQVITKEMLLTMFKHPTAMVGSDGSALAPYGILGKKLVHPRNYGCYPRILGRWVRDEKLISMEEAIRKMTSFPAQILGIQDRGIIREGMWADISIFDPETVIDKATYENPLQYPEGIKYVLVNGKIVIDDGEHTGQLPGKVLRGQGYKTGSAINL